MFCLGGEQNDARRLARPAIYLDQAQPFQDQREAFVARMVVKQVLQTLSDDEARPAERLEARRELYRQLIAAGVVD